MVWAQDMRHDSWYVIHAIATRHHTPLSSDRSIIYQDSRLSDIAQQDIIYQDPTTHHVSRCYDTWLCSDLYTSRRHGQRATLHLAVTESNNSVYRYIYRYLNTYIYTWTLYIYIELYKSFERTHNFEILYLDIYIYIYNIYIYMYIYIYIYVP